MQRLPLVSLFVIVLGLISTWAWSINDSQQEERTYIDDETEALFDLLTLNALPERYRPSEYFVVSNITLMTWDYALPDPENTLLLFNYRLLMRSTYDHEDRVRYCLTDAEGRGQPIPDAVFMVMSRPKSKVYYRFIKLSGIFLHKDWTIHSYCFLSRPLR